MEHKIIVVGIGPGSPDYLVPVAKRKIEAAKVLIGSTRALAAYSTCQQITQVIDRNLAAVMLFITKQLQFSDVVVMVSGDPGYYSLLPALRKEFTDRTLEVIPGISSFQLAFTRISRPWQDVRLLSMHGREIDAADLVYNPGQTLSLLTDAIHNPQSIAKKLIAGGWPATVTAYLCANLSYAQEKIVTASLAEVTAIDGFDHAVMVVEG